MAILAPSMLAADPVNLQRDLTMTEEQGVKWLHVDIMDGLFVPNISYGPDMVKAIHGFSNLVLDVHLMIQQPIRYIEQFCKAGADYLTIHVESDTPENTMEALKKIREFGVKPGVVVKPKTPAEAVAPFLPYVDIVLVMTVEPGFGGQKFMADMMPKAKQLRQMIDEVNPTCYLEVDGGVSMENCQLCKDNGINVLVAGSAFYKAADKKACLAEVEK